MQVLGELLTGIAESQLYLESVRVLGIVGNEREKSPDRTAALVTDANRNRVAGIVLCLMMHAIRAGSLLFWLVCSRANELLGRKLRISSLSDDGTIRHLDTK
jgi:hypothetical protein